MRFCGKKPNVEQRKNSIDILKMAKINNEISNIFWDYKLNERPKSLKKWAKTLTSDVTNFLPGAIEFTNE